MTERLRIGTFVFNVNLRHPAVRAQDPESLDVLSLGRLDIGIGGGWNRPEHDAMGIPLPSVGERWRCEREAIAVLKVPSPTARLVCRQPFHHHRR